ncbi:hypothetical protein [Mycolicibacterium sp.]|uniref:hypothetical protein n=1 Tax=Mycolicibacterium sp. TaxID=2320850 RepID=UPI00355D6FC1
MAISTEAAKLQVGDIVHIASGVSGRVDKIIGTTDKTITYQFTYVRCDPYPSSVGTSRSNRHQLRTVVEVDRSAGGERRTHRQRPIMRVSRSGLRAAVGAHQ